MHNLLAEARGVDRPRIVAGGVQRKQAEHAAVPRPDFLRYSRCLLVHQVEAVTGRTKVRTYATSEALARNCFPNIILEPFIQAGLDVLDL